MRKGRLREIKSAPCVWQKRNYRMENAGALVSGLFFVAVLQVPI
jgi:hypothetical protein